METPQKISEKIDEKIHRLTRIKDDATKEKLNSASADELKKKIVEINQLATEFNKIWDHINPEDHTDAETNHWANEKQRFSTLKTETTQPIQQRITELEELVSKAQEAGALVGAHEAPAPPNGQVSNLHRIYDQMIEEKKNLSNTLKTTSIITLENKWSELKVLRGSFLAKWMYFDRKKISVEEKEKLDRENDEISVIYDEMDARYSEKIDFLKGKEELGSKIQDIEESDIRKKRAEKMNDELESLRQQLDALRNTRSAPGTGTGEMGKSTEIRDLDEAGPKYGAGSTDEAGPSYRADPPEVSLTSTHQTAPPQEPQVRGAIMTTEENSKFLAEIMQKMLHALETTKKEMNRMSESAEKEKTETNNKIKALEKKICRDTIESQPDQRNVPSTSSGGDVIPIRDNNSGGHLVGGDVIRGRTKKDDAVVQLKLDTINLPYFSGDLTEWISFKDLFTYLVHENSNLSDTLKFHQLRSHLKNTALDTIRGYQVSGHNYEAAWNDLKRRYDRKDELIQEYIRRFLEVPAIFHKANFAKLRTIVDATNQMMRALPSLGANVIDWDPFILLIMTLKLDEETRSEWKRSVGRKENVQANDLIEFLEVRAIDLQPSQGDRLSYMLKGDVHRRQPKRIFQVRNTEESPKPKEHQCPLCAGNHRIWNCDKLKKECAKVRTDMIKSLQLCFKCLLKHKLGICENEDCSYCGGPHNILLCYKKENDTKKGAIQRNKPSAPQRYQSSAKPKDQNKPKDQPGPSNDDDWN